MLRALVPLLLTSVLVACGGQAPPPATPAGPPSSSEPPALPKSLGKPRMTVEYVVVHTKWVEKTMTPNGSDVSAWYETPEGKAAVRPERREMQAKSRKDAEVALARAKKGEYGAGDEAAFSSAADATFDKLAPGDAAIVNVSPAQFVVVAKARPTDMAIEKAYKKAKAPELTQRLGASLLTGLAKQDADARAVIASVVSELLGEKAVADPDRPVPVVVDGDRLRHARLQPKAKEAVGGMLETAKAGETVKEPVVDGATITIARALPPSDH